MAARPRSDRLWRALVAAIQTDTGRPRHIQLSLSSRDEVVSEASTRSSVGRLFAAEQARGFDLRRVEQDLRAKLADWRRLLSRNVAQARQALRSLVPERLTFIPEAEGRGTLLRVRGDGRTWFQSRSRFRQLHHGLTRELCRLEAPRLKHAYLFAELRSPGWLRGPALDCGSYRLPRSSSS